MKFTCCFSDAALLFLFATFYVFVRYGACANVFDGLYIIPPLFFTLWNKCLIPCAEEELI